MPCVANSALPPPDGTGAHRHKFCIKRCDSSSFWDCSNHWQGKRNFQSTWEPRKFTNGYPHHTWISILHWNARGDEANLGGRVIPVKTMSGRLQEGATLIKPNQSAWKWVQIKEKSSQFLFSTDFSHHRSKVKVETQSEISNLRLFTTPKFLTTFRPTLRGCLASPRGMSTDQRVSRKV